MYLDEVFNNFLGTLHDAPDIRIDNPGLEQGKFVNNRARYYDGKIVPTTNGDCKVATITMQKPDLDLIERSSGPEYGTVMEGFIGGSVVEGYGGWGNSAVTSSRDDYVKYETLSKLFTSKSIEYNSALKTYNTFIQSYNYTQYLDTYVRLLTKAAVPAGTTPEIPATYDTYYINKYGFKYKIPTPTPDNLIPSPPISIPIIAPTNFANLPPQSAPYTVSANQRLNLAGTIAKYADNQQKSVYAWIDIEGIAHTFDSTVLSDTVNNCHATCWAKKSTMSSSDSFGSLALFTAAMGGSAMIGSPITKANNIACIELPSKVIALKTELNTIEANLRLAADKLRIHAHNHDAEVNAVGDAIQHSAPRTDSELSEYRNIHKNMTTYDGKVYDSGLNVKSKLGYYLLWLSLMIFVVVVTFRNIASSDSPESGSFMISAVLLIILMIYLFNYLSEFRLGPQQLLSKAAGDLPEKVSGMMKFTFT
jgi:hypothetical protein